MPWFPRTVQSGSRGFTQARLAVVGFRVVSVRQSPGSFGFALFLMGTSGSIGFAWVHSSAPRDPRVQSGSLGSSGLFKIAFFHTGEPRCSFSFA